MATVYTTSRRTKSARAAEPVRIEAVRTEPVIQEIPVSFAKKVYVDMEAMHRWFIIKKVPVTIAKLNGQFTFTLHMSDGDVCPFVPLIPYSEDVTCISAEDIRAAAEMTRNTIKDMMIEVNGLKKSFVDVVVEYARRCTIYATDSTGIYDLCNKVTKTLNIKMGIINQAADIGPKGTPITRVTLGLGGEKVCCIVCMSKGYMMRCTMQRFFESVLKDAQESHAALILQQIFMF